MGKFWETHARIWQGQWQKNERGQKAKVANATDVLKSDMPNDTCRNNQVEVA